ncbi:MAG: hypothetical protein RR137_06925 [Odoribacter sp.]
MVIAKVTKKFILVSSLYRNLSGFPAEHLPVFVPVCFIPIATAQISLFAIIYTTNASRFPCLEVAYTCTLFTGESLGVESKRRFTNQDRYFSVRLRLLKEGKYRPGIVASASDPFTSSGHKFDTKVGNGYFSRFFLAATKHILINQHDLGIHLSYLYNDRLDYPLNGITGGITYSPAGLANFRITAEYDTKDFAAGINYLLFRHFYFQIEMQRLK